jgi:ADP-heptose:LPS heptosyltransferase
MKIIVVQIGRIGDTVLTTAMFRAIAAAVPGAEIHALVSARGWPVLRNNPRIKKVLVYRKDPFSLLLLLLRLRLACYDWWIDPKGHPSTESSFFASAGGARNKVGYNKPGGGPFTIPLPFNEGNIDLHAVERNMQCCAALGVPPHADARPELFPLPLLQETIRGRYIANGTKTVLVNVSAGDRSRYWTIDKWAEVAGFCLSKGLRVLVTFPPHDAEMAQRLKALQPGITLFDSITIQDVIALVPLVNLVVTLDTSVVHIASAFNVPQIALFPDVDWNVKKFRPLSDNSVVIMPENGSSVESVKVQRVVDAVEKMLSEIGDVK